MTYVMTNQKFSLGIGIWYLSSELQQQQVSFDLVLIGSSMRKLCRLFCRNINIVMQE
jgi:hypothetical protein